MKIRFRPTIFKIGIIGILLCSIPFIGMAGQTGPKAVIETKDYDFGSVMEGNDVVQDFVIKNTGDAPLDIQKVRTG